MAKRKRMSAIPPDDYKGSIGDWQIALIERGLWDESSGIWYGDIQIECDVYWEILDECEK